MLRQRHLRVIIIGAGIAGLSAARRLHDNGIECIVLEARDRIGGRIHTTRLPDGRIVELGASLMHGVEQNCLVKFAEQTLTSDAPVRLVPGPPTLVLTGPGQPVLSVAASGQILVSVEDALEKACANVVNDDMSVSIKTALVPYLHEAAEKYRIAYEQLECASDIIAENCAAELDKVSIYGVSVEEPLVGEDMLVVGGYIRLVENMAGSEVLRRVRLEHIVTAIDYTDQEVVHVVTANHGTFTADAVIVCVPLGVLKAQSILFTPSLSQRRQQAISSLGMGEHNKVVLVFDRHQQAFWPVGHAFITLRPDNLAETDADAAKDVLARRAILFQEMPTCFAEEYPNLGVDKNTFGPILIAYVHCSLASTLETYTENQLMDAFIRHLARYFPKAAQARMTTCTMSHWCQDAFSRGSYTYVPVHGCIEDIHILAQPCDRYGDMDVSPINLATTHSRPRVFWAGEHTSLTQHSYVHGAYQTGQRAAQELITYFQNEPTSI